MAYGSVNADLMTTSDGVSSSGLYGFKNRLINSAMVIDQRNAGAAVTTSGSYAVDRWFFNNASDATLSVQQSTDVPSGSGFKYSLKMTATAGDATIGASQYCNLQHRVEGFNFADMGFGASGASSVTLSFWVKATVAGNYSVALYNGAENRINPQQFSVSASNTWEQKTITYAGDTSGTWLTTNGTGAQVTFYPALGSNFLGSAGWNAGGTFGVTGQSNAIASNSNIFAITGVQLEKGSTATSFDYRPFGTEFVLCQRYYETTYAYGVVAGTVNADAVMRLGGTFNFGGTIYNYIPLKVNKRASPTITFYNISTGASGFFDGFTAAVANTQVAVTNNNSTSSNINISWTNITQNFVQGHITVSSEL
jgi:hypothetical protein